MGVIVPFSGGEGREVFDWRFRLKSIPVCILLRETPSVCVVEHWSPCGFNGPCLLQLYIAHRASCLCGRSWGPFGLWAHQFSSDCFGLVLTTARDGVERQARIWLVLECKVMPGETEDGFPRCWEPSEYLGQSPWAPCMALAECMLLQGILMQTWLCVHYIKGKCSAMNSSIHFITLIWFRFSITHKEWTSEFSHD